MVLDYFDGRLGGVDTTIVWFDKVLIDLLFFDECLDWARMLVIHDVKVRCKIRLA